MRRTHALIAGFLFVVASAAGQEIRVPASGNPRADHKAIDAAFRKAALSPTPVQVVLADGLSVDRPVWLPQGRLDVRGAVPGARLSSTGQFPPIVMLSDNPACQDGTLPPGPRPWTRDHYKDSHGILDATMAPAPGKWTGMRTFTPQAPDTVYALPHSPFNLPNTRSWSEIRAFTTSLGYRGDPHYRQGHQIGGLEISGWPKPWYVYSWGPAADPTTGKVTPLVHVVTFATEAVGIPNGTWRSFSFPILETGNFRRLTFTIDLDAAKVAAWSGGKRVECNLAGLGADFKPGLRFVDCGLATMKLGGLGFGIDAWQDNFGGPTSMAFHGLRLDEGWPFSEVPPGSDQITADGRKATDRDRFLWELRPHSLIAALDLASPPQDARLIPWAASRPQWCRGYGLALLGGSHCHPYNASFDLRFSDLSLSSGGPETYRYGAAFWSATTIGGGATFERMSFRGGQDGFGGLMAGACYPVVFDNCRFRGETGNGLTIHYSTVKFTGRTDVYYPARNGLAFVRSGADMANVFMSECGKDCLTNVSLLMGGKLTIRDFMFDTEYNPAPTLAVVLAERNVWGDSPGSRVEMSNGVIDGGLSGVPLVLLRDTSGEKGYPGKFEIRGVQSWHPGRGPTLQTDGPMWTGRIVDFLGTVRGSDGASMPAVPTLKHVPVWGPQGKIEIVN